MTMIEPPQFPAHVPGDRVIDYSFADQQGVELCPFAANSAVHELPDIFYSRGAYRSGSSWIVSSAAMIREIYTNPNTFSSRNCTGFLRLLGKDLDLIPVEVDPPEHRLYRSILNSRFTPAEMTPMEPGLRQRARGMIESLKRRPRFEFAAEFGRPYPVRIFLDLMALPTSRLEEFVEWEEKLLHGETLDVITEGANAIMNYLEEVIPERKNNLGDDLLSTIISARIDDRPITDDEIFAMSFLLFFGGLDTVAATMSFMFKHLAEHPDDQRLLREEPGLIPGAVEEMLRAYSVVSSPRVVAHDVDFHGVTLKQGDRILLATALAGRDPEEFPDADVIDLRRKNIRHLAFAAGPHMCVGAPLARRELRIALEEWLAHAPPFEIARGEQPVTRGRGVFDVQHLPLQWC